MKDHCRHGITNIDAEGITGVGAIYYFDKVTNIGLLDIINKTDEELVQLFYPKDNIEAIRATLIRSLDK